MNNNRIEHYDSILVHYQESLEKNLKQLGYLGHIPTLRQIQNDMLKRSMLGNCIVLEGLAVILQSRDSTIDLSTISASTEDGEESRRKLFANPIYVNVAQNYLKFLYKRGMLDLP